MNQSRALLLTVTICCSRIAAFSIFNPPKLIGNPIIQSFSESSTGSKLDIRIDITGNSDSSKLTISGLKLELHNVQPSYAHPNLPGIHGPHPEHEELLPQWKVLFMFSKMVPLSVCKGLNMFHCFVAAGNLSGNMGLWLEVSFVPLI